MDVETPLHPRAEMYQKYERLYYMQKQSSGQWVPPSNVSVAGSGGGGGAGSPSGVVGVGGNGGRSSGYGCTCYICVEYRRASKRQQFSSVFGSPIAPIA